jgi:hypothetical protein
MLPFKMDTKAETHLIIVGKECDAVSRKRCEAQLAYEGGLGGFVGGCIGGDVQGCKREPEGERSLGEHEKWKKAENKEDE